MGATDSRLYPARWGAPAGRPGPPSGLVDQDWSITRAATWAGSPPQPRARRAASRPAASGSREESTQPALRTLRARARSRAAHGTPRTRAWERRTGRSIIMSSCDITREYPRLPETTRDHEQLRSQTSPAEFSPTRVGKVVHRDAYSSPRSGRSSSVLTRAGSAPTARTPDAQECRGW